MDNEQGHEEEENPRKIRVVDKRISARRSSEGDEHSATTTGDQPSAPPEPPSDAPGEPAAAPESVEGDATVTPLRPPPSPQNDHPSAAPAGAPSAGAQATEPPEGRVWTPEQEEEARRMAEEMARIPSIEWVINVAVTLANAAGTKLNEGHWEDGGLAIDALSAIVEKVGPRLGEAEAPLRQTLAQLQMAYAQMAANPEGPPS